MHSPCELFNQCLQDCDLSTLASTAPSEQLTARRKPSGLRARWLPRFEIPINTARPAKIRAGSNFRPGTLLRPS